MIKTDKFILTTMHSDSVYTNYNLNDDIDITNINYNETPYCITLNIIDNNYVDNMKLFQFFINTANVSN